MSCLMVDFWLSGVPLTPRFVLILENRATDEGKKFPLHIGPVSWALLAPALLVQLGPSHPLVCRR